MHIKNTENDSICVNKMNIQALKIEHTCYYPCKKNEHRTDVLKMNLRIIKNEHLGCFKNE